MTERTYIIYFEDMPGYATFRAKNDRDARREARERWYPERCRLPIGTLIQRDTPEKAAWRAEQARREMMWDTAINTGITP